MNSFESFVLLLTYLFLFRFSFSGYSQESGTEISVGYDALYQSVQKKFGVDQELTNGIFYEDQYRDAIGHPFLFDNELHNGYLIFRNKKYDFVRIKYDIYEQHLVLYYAFFGSYVWIIPPNEFVSEFCIDGKVFRRFSFEGGKAGYYQVIYDCDNLKCVYSWSKKRYDSAHKRIFSSFKFTNSKLKAFLFQENAWFNFHNNRSFIRIFPAESKIRIKKYIKQNKIKVTQNDADMKKLLSFCLEL